MKDRRIIQAVQEMPWAILPAKLRQIVQLIQAHTAGDAMTPERARAMLDGPHAEEQHDYQAAHAKQVSGGGSVAVIPVLGTITQRATMLSEFSGGATTDSIARTFRAAVADDSVGSIVLDIDSPGGGVFGVEELAAEIRAARGGDTRIVAVANSLAASAAYWIASAADEVVITPSGEIGSIGVFAVHEDASKMLEEQGVEVTLISAGKFKTEGNPFEALSDEARDAIQARVDAYYDAFVKAVAKGRGASTREVRSGFGEGRVVGAKDAVAFGMADRVATFDETIARLAGHGGRRRSGQSATKIDDDISAADAEVAQADFVESVTGRRQTKQKTIRVQLKLEGVEDAIAQANDRDKRNRRQRHREDSTAVNQTAAL